MSDDSEHDKPASEPSPPVSKQAGRVSTDEQDDKGVEAGSAVGKVKVSLQVIREVMASPAVGPYLKYPIMAFAAAILILAAGWVCSWVLK